MYLTRPKVWYLTYLMFSWAVSVKPRGTICVFLRWLDEHLDNDGTKPKGTDVCMHSNMHSMHTLYASSEDVSCIIYSVCYIHDGHWQSFHATCGIFSRIPVAFKQRMKNQRDSSLDEVSFFDLQESTSSTESGSRGQLRYSQSKSLDSRLPQLAVNQLLTLALLLITP